MAMTKSSLSHMADKWPSSIVSQQEVEKFTGGLMSSKYLANLSSLGEAPPSYKIGRKRVFPVSSFITWLESRMEG